MKSVEPRGFKLRRDIAETDPEQFEGVRAYLTALQSHVVRAKPQDLTCMLIVAQSIAGLAPTLGLSETGKRAQTLQIFVRAIIARDSMATEEELGVLSRAYDRLTTAAREEGALSRDADPCCRPSVRVPERAPFSPSRERADRDGSS